MKKIEGYNIFSILSMVSIIMLILWVFVVFAHAVKEIGATGSIQGVITHPYRNAKIAVFSEEQSRIVATVNVASDGGYTVAHLTPGNYSMEIAVQDGLFHYTGIKSGVRKEMPIEGKKYVKFDKSASHVLVGKQIPLSTRKEIEQICQRIVSFNPSPQAVLEQFFSKDFLGGKEGKKQYTYEDMQELYKDKSLFAGLTYAWTTLQMKATEDQVGVFGVFTMLDNPKPGEEFSYKHLSGQHTWLTQYFRRENGAWKLWRQILLRLPGDRAARPYPWRIFVKELSKIYVKPTQSTTVNYTIRLMPFELKHKKAYSRTD